MTARVAQRVSHNGVEYGSMNQLAQQLGVSRQRVAQAIQQGGKVRGYEIEVIQNGN